eukprot:46310_1
MFHIDQSTSSSSQNKEWSNNDMQLLQKLGISPNDQERDHNRRQLKISPNLHPDLKQHAYEEQINSLSTELQQTKNNLKRAAEYGQHLIEENSKLESSALELRNEAAEYIAQILELREENDRCKLEAQSNEYSVNEYQNKVHQITNDTKDLSDALMNLRNELNDMRLKYEMEQSKCKLYQNENKEFQAQMEETHDETEQLKTKILILQNTNHSLLMERNELKKKNESIVHQHTALENEYHEMCNQYMNAKHEDSLFDERGEREESRSHSHRDGFIISRRKSHSRSRSQKREDADEKMDEVMDLKNTNNTSDSDDNEYKSDPIHSPDKKADERNDVLMECKHLFEDILDDQHIHSPIKSMRITSPSNDMMIDVELFRDLIKSVRTKLAEEKYGGEVYKRDISELRRNSKSNSHVLETLDGFMMDQNDAEEEHEHGEHNLSLLKVPIPPHKLIHIESIDDDEEEEDDCTPHNSYEADNEDLDNLPNKAMMIEPIDDRQKQCVEQFLVRYSENESWNETDKCSKRSGENAYELEIEFNENINLENKKNNKLSIGANVLQSLTNLIENIMGIYQVKEPQNSYFSMCGWFCGKTSAVSDEDYSRHYLNILSTLDYRKENREEIYWVIYQLLTVIYKYYNHTHCVRSMSSIQHRDTMGRDTPTDTGNASSSESMSMVFTSAKSKYAELKPPARRKLIKSKLKSHRGRFQPLASSSSEDEPSGESK